MNKLPFLLLVLVLSISCKQKKPKSIVPIVKKAVKTVEKDTTYFDSLAILTPNGKVRWMIDTVVVDAAYREKYAQEEKKKKGNSGMPEGLNTIKGYPEGDTIEGDFNGDGNKEKAWFKYARDEKHYKTDLKKLTQEQIDKLPESAFDVVNDNYLVFSDRTIKRLKIDYIKCGWVLKNEGDLNDDGKDEIGILPGWDSSSCRVYEVFTYTGKKWKMVCEPIQTSWNMRAKGIVLIEKDTTRKGYAIVRESMESYVTTHPHHKFPDKYTNYCNCQNSNVVEYSIKLKK